jgi:hypothetical protein
MLWSGTLKTCPTPAAELCTVIQITWRFFPYSPPGGINLFVAWSIRQRPTLFVIDHKGILRHRYEDSPGEKVLDAVIDQLVQEAEAAQKAGSN